MNIRNSKFPPFARLAQEGGEIRNVLVVTGDPGGARVLIPGIAALRRKHPKWKFDVLAGPNSFGLWKGAGFRPKRWPSRVIHRRAAEKVLQAKGPDILVTGTSFENPTESWFRTAAQVMNVLSFSALDHWCNYKHRFELPGGGLLFPDILGVMDELAARKMVEAGNPRHHIAIVGHPVLEPFLKRKRSATNGKRQILYLSEPISWDGKLNPRVIRYPRHNELTILKKLLAVFAGRSEMRSYSLRIRPHPLEPLTRIKGVLRRHAPAGLEVTIDRSRSLERDFNSSRAVLGITSIALLQALLMRVPVLSLQPDHARGRIPDDILCFLPRVASNGCFIEAVSNFVRTRSTAAKGFSRGHTPRLPKNASSRIAAEIEKLIHG